ncbi:PREDICTED: uncharacterized protein LOC105557274 isoform X2 [Vollenhovia emeryi]|uniref:uncharacterized protein LOC105557274 isoform X2 n=1 Tax=Vollenhovia emeryi TaxID=411798 RepID=UPI0005F3EFD2|nr:PREDICTED: uncharacterized protein LOC105557274 isoform X2 [Vollenhovia emeryi]
MAWLKILSCYILCTAIVVTAQYTSDSEYNDFDFYEDLSTDRSRSFKKEYSVTQDDFYVANDFDDTENQDGAYPGSNLAAFGHNVDSLKKSPFDKQFDWNVQKCDDRSIWTHCLCQFTCSRPDIVDCYTPCRSGCECKEEYVFDERTQRCLLPEECSTEDYNY